MGHQRIKMTDKLASILSIWLDLLEHMLGEWPKYPLWYHISESGNISWVDKPESMVRTIPRLSKKLFGRDLTINSFRHIHEMYIQSDPEYQRMSINEKREIHRQLLHSFEIGQYYNLLRRDEGEVEA